MNIGNAVSGPPCTYMRYVNWSPFVGVLVIAGSCDDCDNGHDNDTANNDSRDYTCRQTHSHIQYSHCRSFIIYFIYNN